MSVRNPYYVQRYTKNIENFIVYHSFQKIHFIIAKGVLHFSIPRFLRLYIVDHHMVPTISKNIILSNETITY